MRAGLWIVGLALVLAGCEKAMDSGGGGESEGEAVSAAQAVVLPPTLPPAPEGATCVLVQRGTAGEVADADVSLGNGTWAAGGYPFSWTGPSPYDHWSLYRFDLSVVPEGAQIVLAAFTNYVSWNEQSSEVRAHRILAPWDEATVTWASFGGSASWDPAVIASFDPIGVGYKTIDVTSLAQGWFAGLYPNHGLLLEEDPVELHSYFASELSVVEQRPSLYVCYADGGPCGGKVTGDACDDGNACTLGETCQNGQCVGGTPKSCDALDACHDAGICDPATGVCSDPEKPDGSPCDDGDACTSADACVAGACFGADITCDDGNVCNGPETCDPASGCQVGVTPLDCDDQNACTDDACDPASGCAHTAVVCDDQNACTADTCDPAAGCTFTAVSCDDQVACTTDSCAGGNCQHLIECAPGQPCSQSFCNSPGAQDPAYAWLCESP
ncbi:MAG: DNRLRE domain-containing protein [Polyangiaceae bacterium]